MDFQKKDLRKKTSKKMEAFYKALDMSMKQDRYQGRFSIAVSERGLPNHIYMVKQGMANIRRAFPGIFFEWSVDEQIKIVSRDGNRVFILFRYTHSEEESHNFPVVGRIGSHIGGYDRTVMSSGISRMENHLRNIRQSEMMWNCHVNTESKIVGVKNNHIMECGYMGDRYTVSTNYGPLRNSKI